MRREQRIDERVPFARINAEPKERPPGNPPRLFPREQPQLRSPVIVRVLPQSCGAYLERREYHGQGQ
jgi:hypothetical protein